MNGDTMLTLLNIFTSILDGGMEYTLSNHTDLTSIVNMQKENTSFFSLLFC